MQKCFTSSQNKDSTCSTHSLSLLAWTTMASSSNATCIEDTCPGRKGAYGPVHFCHRPRLHAAVGQYSVCTKAQ